MITVITGPNAPASGAARDFLVRNRVPHQWLDLETDPLASFVISVVDSPVAACPPCSSRWNHVGGPRDLSTAGARNRQRGPPARYDQDDVLADGAGNARWSSDATVA